MFWIVNFTVKWVLNNIFTTWEKSPSHLERRGDLVPPNRDWIFLQLFIYLFLRQVRSGKWDFVPTLLLQGVGVDCTGLRACSVCLSGKSAFAIHVRHAAFQHAKESQVLSSAMILMDGKCKNNKAPSAVFFVFWIVMGVPEGKRQRWNMENGRFKSWLCRGLLVKGIRPRAWRLRFSLWDERSRKETTPFWV